MFDETRLGVLVLNLEGVVVVANQAAAELLGHVVDDLVGTPGGDLLFEEERVHIDDDARRLAEAGSTRFERRFRRADGRTIWADCLLQTIRDGTGRPEFTFATLLDISGRKRAEDMESHLRAVVDSSPNAIVASTLEGIVTSWNAGAERMYGYQADEVVGHSLGHLLFPASRRAEAGQIVAQLNDGRHLESHLTERLRKDGSTVLVSISASPIVDSDGAVTGLVSVAQDVTERERERERLQLLLQGAPNALVCVDRRGSIVLASRQCETIFGYTPAELIGQPIEILIPEAARLRHPAHRRDFVAAPATRPMGADLGPMGRRKDGTEFPVEVSLSSVDTADGVLVSAAVRDITDRLRLEAERIEMQAEMERAQREEERAVLEAQLHQSQRMESIGQLAGGIAHDFNNLLAGIMNYAALVSSGVEELVANHGLAGDEVASTLVRDAAEITKVAGRAAQLTHQLLIFSRRETIQPEVLDLNSVVAEMEKLLSRIIRESVSLTSTLQPDLPRIRIDPGQLEQVIMNLAVNGRDAMATSGGHLRIATSALTADEEFARLRGIRPGDYVQLAVSDTGIGMPRDVADRAFEPFFSTKPREQGSGLGLATVYGIVTQAGGQVVIYSEVGFGTTVRILLPATHDDVSRPAVHRQPTLTDGQGRVILLVEDEEIVREPARRMLSRHGYRVEVAADADDALALVRDDPGRFDLVITDVVMPGRSGRALAGELAGTGVTAPVLYMSGYTHDVLGHQGVLEDGIHLLEKPFTADTLLRAVRDAIEDR
jgi:hypothetical protein